MVINLELFSNEVTVPSEDQPFNYVKFRVHVHEGTAVPVIPIRLPSVEATTVQGSVNLFVLPLALTLLCRSCPFIYNGFLFLIEELRWEDAAIKEEARVEAIRDFKLFWGTCGPVHPATTMCPFHWEECTCWYCSGVGWDLPSD